MLGKTLTANGPVRQAGTRDSSSQDPSGTPAKNPSALRASRQWQLNDRSVKSAGIDSSHCSENFQRRAGVFRLALHSVEQNGCQANQWACSRLTRLCFTAVLVLFCAGGCFVVHSGHLRRERACTEPAA